MIRAKELEQKPYSGQILYKNDNGIYTDYDDWRHDYIYSVSLIIPKKYEMREDGTYGFDCRIPVFNGDEVTVRGNNDANPGFFWVYRALIYTDENMNSDTEFKINFWTAVEKECINFKKFILNNQEFETDGPELIYSETIIKNADETSDEVEKIITCEIINDKHERYYPSQKEKNTSIKII